MTPCPVCANEMKFLFKTSVLNKYDVSYYQCINCRFIQTEKPYWLKEAYNNAISSLDVGLVQRNIDLTGITEKIIRKYCHLKGIFLDYAGGYGLFVRMMRDKGFNFYRQDIYCENLFAKNFDLEDLQKNTKFELVTAFEVFEHLENPLEEVVKIFNYSDSVLFSTELQKLKDIQGPEDWWYFVPESGQHIAFYTYRSLEIMAERLNCHFYSDGSRLHLFSIKNLEGNPFRIYRDSIYKQLLKKIFNVSQPERNKEKLESLIQNDFNLAKEKILKSRY